MICQVSDGGDAKTTRLCVWNHPGTDVTGMVARCHKVATTTEHVSHIHVHDCAVVHVNVRQSWSCAMYISTPLSADTCMANNARETVCSC